MCAENREVKKSVRKLMSRVGVGEAFIKGKSGVWSWKLRDKWWESRRRCGAIKINK